VAHVLEELGDGARRLVARPRCASAPPATVLLFLMAMGPSVLCHTDAMRTTLEIDDELLASLLARHPGASKREAVERAIAEYLANDAAARTRALAGHVEIEDISGELRRADRRS